MARGAVLSVLLALVLPAPAAAQAKRDTAAASGAASGADSTATDPLAGRTRGSARAPVTVYEMSDFQCPYCREFALTTFPAIDSAYVATGRVRWAFVNFPLTSIHHNAAAAAEVALCAAQQGGF
jgi:protein-disulfide isomerase